MFKTCSFVLFPNGSLSVSDFWSTLTDHHFRVFLDVIIFICRSFFDIRCWQYSRISESIKTGEIINCNILPAWKINLYTLQSKVKKWNYLNFLFYYWCALPMLCQCCLKLCIQVALYTQIDIILSALWIERKGWSNYRDDARRKIAFLSQESWHSKQRGQFLKLLEGVSINLNYL